MEESFEIDGLPEGEIVAEFYLHIIYWSRELMPIFTPVMLAAACELLDQAMFTLEGEALAAGGGGEHLHILVRQSPSHSPQETLDTLRKRLAAWIVESGGPADALHDEDVLVSVSPCDLEMANSFIADQQTHHEVVPFRVELTQLLDEHGFDYDDRTLWE